MLTLSIQTGRALVEVVQQLPGQMLETRIGSTAFGVRGTSFIVGHVEGDRSQVFVTMLSGYGELTIQGRDGVTAQIEVPAGSRVVARLGADVPAASEPPIKWLLLQQLLQTACTILGLITEAL